MGFHTWSLIIKCLILFVTWMDKNVCEVQLDYPINCLEIILAAIVAIGPIWDQVTRGGNRHGGCQVKKTQLPAGCDSGSGSDDARCGRSWNGGVMFDVVTLELSFWWKLVTLVDGPSGTTCKYKSFWYFVSETACLDHNKFCIFHTVWTWKRWSRDY